MKKGVLKWIFFSISLLINSFILIQSCLPGEISNKQSIWFSSVLADIINTFKKPDNEKVVKLEEIVIKKTTGSETIKGGDSEDIIIANTNGYKIELKPNDTTEKNIVFSYDNNKNNKNEKIVNVVQSGLTFYVEAVGNVGDTANITLYSQTNPDIKTSFSVNVIDRLKPNPNDYELEIDEEVKKNGLKKGLSTQIRINLIEKEGVYLRKIRKYNPYEITFTSTDEEIASVDEYGVIHAHKKGEVTIRDECSGETFPLKILDNDSTLIYPNDDWCIEGNENCYIYDMDYDTPKEEFHNKLKINWGKNEPSDTGITWLSSDFRKLYIDYDGIARGYKIGGKVTVTAISNMDNKKQKTFEIDVIAKKASTMEIKINNQIYEDNGNIELCVDETMEISAILTPKNVYDTNIKITSGDERILKVSNLGRSGTIKGIKKGETTLSITSSSNTELKKTLHVKVNAKKAINETDIKDFNIRLRKSIGHFSIFIINGAFLTLTLLFFLKDNHKFKNKYLLFGVVFISSLTLGFIFAGLSEFAQLLAIDRGPSWLDVFIDWYGFSIGLGIVLLISILAYVLYYLFKRKKNKNEA